MPAPFLAPTDAGGPPEQVLRRLDLVISRRLDGILHGEYAGLVPGHGTDLGETREYLPGDDVRRIDWNVTARTQAPHVRETIADRELETWVLVDRSPSLDFGTARCEKRDLALFAAAAIGFLTNRTGNRFGAMVLTPHETTTVPARGGKDHLMAALHQVLHARSDATGTTDLGRALVRLGGIHRRRGLAVVISDFLSPPETWARAVGQLAVRHEVLCVEIVDPRELVLPSVGVLQLVDPRTGELLDVQTGNEKVRERFAAAAQEQRQIIDQAMRAAGADHLRLQTDGDWLMDLIQFVAARRDRVRGLSRQVVR